MKDCAGDKECLHLDIGFFNKCKQGQVVSGDSFISTRLPGGRVVSVLSDGLGSGIKANVLSTLTATMASKFVSSDMDIKLAAKSIFKTLPICRHRKITYSTFVIIDINSDGVVKVIEYASPEYVVIRSGKRLNIDIEVVEINSPVEKDGEIRFSSFTAEPEDRMVFFSDGVEQAGIGVKGNNIAWDRSGLENFIVDAIQSNSDVSAQRLAERVVEKASQVDVNKPRDDISCGVVYYRHPRKALVVSGPPYDKDKDKYLAERLNSHVGMKIVCGGTTAAIVAREWGGNVYNSACYASKEMPYMSEIQGIDLVTEGGITLQKVLRALKSNSKCVKPISLFVDSLLNSDLIEFIVGTRLNEAHFDPQYLDAVDIRISIIKRIKKVLESKYYKKVVVEFV